MLTPRTLSFSSLQPLLGLTLQGLLLLLIGLVRLGLQLRANRIGPAAASVGTPTPTKPMAEHI